MLDVLDEVDDELGQVVALLLESDEVEYLDNDITDETEDIIDDEVEVELDELDDDDEVEIHQLENEEFEYRAIWAELHNDILEVEAEPDIALDVASNELTVDELLKIKMLQYAELDDEDVVVNDEIDYLYLDIQQLVTTISFDDVNIPVEIIRYIVSHLTEH